MKMSSNQRILVAVIGPKGFRSEEWIRKKKGKEITHKTVMQWDEDLWRTPYGWRAMWKEIIAMFRALYAPVVGDYFLVFGTFNFKKNKRDEYLEWAHILRELPLPIRAMIWIHRFKGKLGIMPVDEDIYERLMNMEVTFTDVLKEMNIDYTDIISEVQRVSVDDKSMSLDTLKPPFTMLYSGGGNNSAQS